MIICSPDDFEIGSIHKEIVTDENSNDHNLTFYVKRKATEVEWRTYLKEIGGDRAEYLGEPLWDKFYEIVAD